MHRLAGCDLGILTLALEGLKDIKNEWNIVVKSVRKGHAQMAASMSQFKLTNLQPLQRASMHTGTDTDTGTPDAATYDKTNSIAWTRKYKDIRQMIQDAPTLTNRVKDMAVDVFHCLAKAEAACHGVSVEDVHFHEVGAVDSAIDTVGCVVALNLLGVEEVSTAPTYLLPRAASTRSTAFCLCQPRPLCVF